MLRSGLSARAPRPVELRAAALDAFRFAGAEYGPGLVGFLRRKPLGAILANADAAEILIERGRLVPEEIPETIADIGRQDPRASEVIRRMRSLARRREARTERLEGNAVVEDVRRLLSTEMKRRQVRVSLDLDPTLPGCRPTGSRSSRSSSTSS